MPCCCGTGTVTIGPAATMTKQPRQGVRVFDHVYPTRRATLQRPPLEPTHMNDGNGTQRGGENLPQGVLPASDATEHSRSRLLVIIKVGVRSVSQTQGYLTVRGGARQDRCSSSEAGDEKRIGQRLLINVESHSSTECYYWSTSASELLPCCSYPWKLLCSLSSLQPTHSGTSTACLCLNCCLGSLEDHSSLTSNTYPPRLWLPQARVSTSAPAGHNYYNTTTGASDSHRAPLRVEIDAPDVQT